MKFSISHFAPSHPLPVMPQASLLLSTLLQLSFLLSPLALSAQKQGEDVVTGWSFGVFPTVSYSNTLGFQYGAYSNVFYYGDGTSYPDPLHKISFEASHFTEGRSRFYLAFDSKSLIPTLRVTLSTLYVLDPLYFFYGYNGAAQSYSSALNDQHHYNVDRAIFQSFANFQYTVTGSHKVVAGISFSNYRFRDFDANKYGGDNTSTLYRSYINDGLIGDDECSGGNVLELRGGFCYDTRDIEAAPNSGLLLEAFLNPGFSAGHSYLKTCVYFSHFLRIPIPMPGGDPVFAYRLAWVGTPVGDAPFFIQQSVPMLVPHTMLTEGYGSAKTIRGYFENRIICDGIFWGNFELRVKLFKFSLWGQHFYTAVNPFFDCGIITQTYRNKRQNEVQISTPSPYSPLVSFGTGFKLAWNENFILSAEFARCIDAGLGDGLWVDLGINYAF